MLKSILTFALSALLFILVFILVVIESQEAFIITIFLGTALILAIVGVYFVSQRDDKSTLKEK